MFFGWVGGCSLQDLMLMAYYLLFLYFISFYFILFYLFSKAHLPGRWNKKKNASRLVRLLWDRCTSNTVLTSMKIYLYVRKHDIY